MSDPLKYVKVREAYESFIKDCVKVGKGSLIYEAIEEILRAPTAQTIYIVDEEGRLAGLLPLRDLIRVSSARYGVRGKGFGGFIQYLSDVMKDNVDEIMRPPLSVGLDDSLRKAMKIMESYALSNLPVVDKDRKLVGELNGIEILKFAHEGVKKGDLRFKEMEAEEEKKKREEEV